MRRYLGATWLCQCYLNVTLKVHNKTKILVSKKERPIANPYDNFISVHSMTFDLEECVQTVHRYGLHTAHSLNASLYDQ